MGPLANFWASVSVPDNIPIVFMLLLVGYFTYLSFDEARKNDRLIREGRKDQILRRMQDWSVSSQRSLRRPARLLRAPLRPMSSPPRRVLLPRSPSSEESYSRRPSPALTTGRPG